MTAGWITFKCPRPNHFDVSADTPKPGQGTEREARARRRAAPPLGGEAPNCDRDLACARLPPSRRRQRRLGLQRLLQTLVLLAGAFGEDGIGQ